MLPGAPRISAAGAGALKSKEAPFNAVLHQQSERRHGTERPDIHLNEVTPFDF